MSKNQKDDTKKVLEGKKAKEFEDTITEVSNILAKKKICFAGAFGRFEEGYIQCRTRTMLNDENDSKSITMLWVALQRVETLRQQLESFADKKGFDLNEGLGGVVHMDEKTTRLPGLP